MSDLSGSTVVVAGGTGNVGEGIVAELLARGARVIVPSREATRLEALAAGLGAPAGLVTVPADLGTPDGRACLGEALAGRPIRAAVASLGGFWQGPPALGLPEAELERVLDGGLRGHLRAAQTLLPRLAGPESSYVQINGLAALVAIPGSSALSISAAAQLALTRSLIAEAGPDGPTIVSLVIAQLVKGRGLPDLPEGSLTAREVGRVVADLVTAPRGHGLHRLGKDEGRVGTAPL